MTGATPGELAKTIRDLLVVARVAMPPSLYAQDPRISTAAALLKRIEQGSSSSRPPNTSVKPAGFDVTALAVSRAVEESREGISFVVDMSWDLVEASWRAMTEDRSYPLDPNDAVDYVLRDWFTSHGYGMLLPRGDEEPH
jgi:hypothetical protein